MRKRADRVTAAELFEERESLIDESIDCLLPIKKTGGSVVPSHAAECGHHLHADQLRDAQVQDGRLGHRLQRLPARHHRLQRKELVLLLLLLLLFFLQSWLA